MMSLKTKDLFPLMIFVFMVVLMIIAIDYPWEAQLLPLIIGSIVVILVILQLVIEKNKSINNRLGYLVRKEEMNESTDDENKEDKEKLKEDELVNGKELTIFLWIIFLGVAIYLLPYILGVLCFLFLLLKIYAKLSWLKTLLVTFIITGCLYLLFSVLLKIAV